MFYFDIKFNIDGEIIRHIKQIYALYIYFLMQDLSISFVNVKYTTCYNFLSIWQSLLYINRITSVYYKTLKQKMH